MNSNYKQQTYLIAGVILLAIGLLWLFKAIGIELPEHLISLPTLVIVTGLVILVKAQFKSESGWIVFSFGTVLLLNRLIPNQNLLQIGTASILAILGAYYLLRYFTDGNNLTGISSLA
jgi:MFS superfamily sulfate permease-like transporter